MANNRLYIVDPETGENFMIAKAMGSGWYTTFSTEELDAWLHMRDYTSSYGDAPTTLILEDENNSAKRDVRLSTHPNYSTVKA